MATLKIAMLGDGGVGKTSLTTLFCRDVFYDDYDPTIAESYLKQVLIDNEPYTLDILDTAGCEEYSAMRDQYIRSSNAFLVVYSITSRASFIELENFMMKVAMVKDIEVKDIPAVIVGNKCDLESDREVCVEDVREMERKWGAPMLEVSAKENVNVEKAFHEVVQIWKKRQVEHVEYQYVDKRKKSKCAVL